MRLSLYTRSMFKALCNELLAIKICVAKHFELPSYIYIHICSFGPLDSLRCRRHASS
jgi:hypothetical protein